MINRSKSSFYTGKIFDSPPFGIKLLRLYLKILALFSKKIASKKVANLFLTPRTDTARITKRYDELGLFKDGETFFTESNGHQIFTYREGEPKVLLVYGWESSFHRLDDIMRELRKNGIGFLTFDLPAHGYSQGKQNDAYISSKIVTDLLRRNPTINTLIGHSFGGGVSYLALENQNNVEKLITIGTPTHYLSIITPLFLMLDVSEEIQEGFYEKLKLDLGRDLRDYDLPNVTIHNRVQFLTIHDKDDKTIPYTDAIRLKESLKDRCELYLTESLGHRKLMHDKVVVDKIIEFIKSDH